MAVRRLQPVDDYGFAAVKRPAPAGMAAGWSRPGGPTLLFSFDDASLTRVPRPADRPGRRVLAPARARSWWHGDRLPRARCAARPRRRHQGPAESSRPQDGRTRALSPRGAHGGGTLTPAHRPDPSGERGWRLRLLRHELRGRRD